ncbi:UDP-N-acetylmuramoyl-tripeptide--D-alanyl-D-alanine ligase [Rodentibacter caecimuris]|uniref:UDP-N-acetylmuramoyl-tripeptide--D-alanyl-D-alanine ligase n=1 Tax=Rodentibacter caecimuris TaxID=1796644 RepID=A0ABX3KY81_9PAST|nr:UDP-N-acetylmuramoyl-tripeptide--D-alanyl-D-alanine ligase [Rodentibacter heylii]
MITLSTKQLKNILAADLVGSENIYVNTISTDTRQYVADSLFFALKGENFDAHLYLDKAVQQGAVALVVNQLNLNIQMPQLIVEDTRLALGLLAKWLREKINPQVVAMTGSSGKTTVKEMTASILQKSAVNSEAVLFTQGNFNNDIGVPLTLLRLTDKHRFAIIELGANHQGEIDYTTKLVQPDVALVNNVAPAHLEGFGSLQGVVIAKGEIYRGLTQKGVALINVEHNYFELWQQDIGTHKVQYFNGKDYLAENICQSSQRIDFILSTPKGKIPISLPYLGLHNVKNALAATALAMNVGATLENVKAGLEQYSQVKGRLFPIQVNPNLLLLDDTYNANVDSLKAAIDVLKSYPAFRILVVGDMKELGVDSALCHRQIAEYAKQAGLDLILSFGSESSIISELSLGRHFTDKIDLLNDVKFVINEKLKHKQNVVLLAKGSRSMKMEEIIYPLKDLFIC